MNSDEGQRPGDPIDATELPPTEARQSGGLGAVIASGADASTGAAIEETGEEQLDEVTEDEANPV